MTIKSNVIVTFPWESKTKTKTQTSREEANKWNDSWEKKMVSCGFLIRYEYNILTIWFDELNKEKLTIILPTFIIGNHLRLTGKYDLWM